jgi:hypothetical protein
MYDISNLRVNLVSILGLSDVIPPLCDLRLWCDGVQRDNFAFDIWGGKVGKLSALRNDFEYPLSNTGMM